MLPRLGRAENPPVTVVAGSMRVFRNDRGVLLSVITQLLPYIGYPRTLNALRVINEVTSP